MRGKDFPSASNTLTNASASTAMSLEAIAEESQSVYAFPVVTS